MASTKSLMALRAWSDKSTNSMPVRTALAPDNIESELLDVSKAEDRKAIGLSIEKLLELLIAARRLRDV